MFDSEVVIVIFQFKTMSTIIHISLTIEFIISVEQTKLNLSLLSKQKHIYLPNTNGFFGKITQFKHKHTVHLVLLIARPLKQLLLIYKLRNLALAGIL